MLGVVALVALIVILAAASSGGDEGGGSSGGGTVPSGYTAQVETEFMAECGGGDLCECMWDGIVEQIPFEDFAVMEAQLRDDPELANDPEAVAAEFPDIATIVEGCATGA